MKTPNLFIVGHPRSGTSSLHSYLRQHPDIFMTAIKEPNFFSSDFRNESDRFHKKRLYFPYRTENQYLRLYKKWTHEKIAGEASATYLCSRTAAREISHYNPAAKIIMMFREPTQFLHSFHSAARFALGEHHQDFKTAIEAEKDRREGRGFAGRVITPSWLFYSEFVKYTAQINRFCASFDPAQIKIIIFDDFKMNTPKMYKEVLEFLDVDPDFSPDFDIVNPNKQLRWPLLKKYTLDSPYFRKTLRLLFSDNTYAGLKDFYKNKLVKYAPREDLDETSRLELMQGFKPEVEKLSEFLKIDLVAIWGYHNI
ncbi:MAG: sulfotransferase [Desulfobacterales bacterium]|jgi:hypothetical protein